MPQVYADERVTIEVVADLGRFGNNAYILRPAQGGPATLVDIPEGFEAVLETLQGTPVERIVVTHSHLDHWGGYDVMRSRLDAPVYVAAAETNIDPARPVERLEDAAVLMVGEVPMQVLHTPGHTPGSICLLVGPQGEGGALLTGDTLFPGGPGRTRDHQALLQEIESITGTLYVLEEATVVLPGHGAATTIGESRREYEVFAAKEHDPDLHGDVLWLES
jgi:hydroxyacylglutathione hydrolase